MGLFTKKKGRKTDEEERLSSSRLVCVQLVVFLCLLSVFLCLCCVFFVFVWCLFGVWLSFPSCYFCAKLLLISYLMFVLCSVDVFFVRFVFSSCLIFSLCLIFFDVHFMFTLHVLCFLCVHLMFSLCYFHVHSMLTLCLIDTFVCTLCLFRVCFVVFLL